MIKLTAEQKRALNNAKVIQWRLDNPERSKEIRARSYEKNKDSKFRAKVSMNSANRRAKLKANDPEGFKAKINEYMRAYRAKKKAENNVS